MILNYKVGVIIGIDDSILPALNLDIEKGLWRDISDLEWNAWGMCNIKPGNVSKPLILRKTT